MSDSDSRGVLNRLIESCKDAETGLRHAEGLVSDPALKSAFATIADQRAQFAAELLPQAQRLGGAATADGTASASVHRHWMDLRNVLSGHDDGATLAEVKRGDNMTLVAFKDALAGVLPSAVRDLVGRQYEAIRANHDLIEVLQSARRA